MAAKASFTAHTLNVTARSTAISGRSRSRSVDPLSIISRMQARDQAIARLLDEHRTLTTDQIAAVCFTSTGTAAGRLYELRQVSWLNRFIPARGRGRPGVHWILGPLGATWSAGYDGRIPPLPSTHSRRAIALSGSANLAHTDGTNQFFVDLLVNARTQSQSRLERWWAPQRTADAFGQRVHPDGHGVWREGGEQVGFLLEYDTGTETLGRLKDKLDPYVRLRRDGGPDYPVLFYLPSPVREANFHRKLNGLAATLPITVATATPSGAGAHPDGPAGPIWKVAGNGRSRYRLAALPSRPGRPGAYHPGPPTPEQDPLFLLSDQQAAPQ